MLKNKLVVAVVLGLLMPTCLMAAKQLKSNYAQPYYTSTSGEYTQYLCNDQQYPQIAKGLTPVYYLYIGRHGARYTDGHATYSRILRFFAEADSLHNLSPKGNDFYAWYQQFYPLVAGKEGKLSAKGRQQLADIASSVDKAFALWWGDSVRVISSTSPRVIHSSEAFMQQLSKLNPSLRYATDTLKLFAVRNGWQLPTTVDAAYDSLLQQVAQPEAFLKQYLLNPNIQQQSLQRNFYGAYGFQREFRNVLAAIPGIDQTVPEGWQAFLSDSLNAAVQQLSATQFYLLLGRAQQTHQLGMRNYTDTWNYLQQLLQSDLQTGQVKATFCFTHDILIDNLLARLQLGSFGQSVPNLSVAASQFAIQCVPMAANLQLVVCKVNNKNKWVVYPLLNGRFIEVAGLKQAYPGAYKLNDLVQRCFDETGYQAPVGRNTNQEMAVLYGSVSEKNRTEAVAHQKKESGYCAYNDVYDIFRGRFAGVTVVGSDIVIRGIGSANAAIGALVLLNGVPFSGNLSAISPCDIESISIIKDASTSLYGTRGANGVVLIQLKNAQ